MSTPYKVPRPQHSTSGESRTGRFSSPTGAPVSNHGLQQYEYYDQSLVETDTPYVPGGGFSSQRHHHYPQGVSRIPFLSLSDLSIFFKSHDTHNPGHPVTYNDLQPQTSFNREHYPAYGSEGHRAGPEHVRHESSPSQNRNPGQGYYRFRQQTHIHPESSPSSNSASPSDDDQTIQPFQFASYSHRSPEPDLRASTIVPSHYEYYTPISNSYNQSSRSSEGRSPSSPLSSPKSQHRRYSDTEAYLRHNLDIPPPISVNLNALRDPPPGEKPSEAYPTLIKLAIHGSPNGQLTLQGIQKAIETRFEYYRYKSHNNEKAWKVNPHPIVSV
jgi:hypothetical protein